MNARLLSAEGLSLMRLIYKVGDGEIDDLPDEAVARLRRGGYVSARLLTSEGQRCYDAMKAADAKVRKSKRAANLRAGTKFQSTHFGVK